LFKEEELDEEEDMREDQKVLKIENGFKIFFLIIKYEDDK
jgi:hypothetical protein